MTRRKIAIIIAVLVVISFAVKEGIRKYPDVKADILEQIRRGEIYELSGVDNAEGFHAKMDTLVAFVNNNSVHNIDDEFWSDFKNKPRSLDKFLAYARGESKDRPHMECSTRSKILLPLVRKAGYEAHMVDLFRYNKTYDSHVIVEVKNPDTGKWEVYDPTYQVYWKNTKTGERAAMRDLVMEKDFSFIPCHDAKRCGFSRKDHPTPIGKKMAGYLGYAVVMNDEGDGETVFNNKKRFDLTKLPEDGKNLFCDWGGKRWCPGLVNDD